MKIYIVKPSYHYEGSGTSTKAFVDESKAEGFKQELEAWYSRRPKIESYYIDNGTFIPDVDESFDQDYDTWMEEYPDYVSSADYWTMEEVELVQ